METVIITSTKRLARQLMHHTSQQAHTVVLPLNEWLTACWQQIGTPYPLLNKHQEQLLWEQVIQAASDEHLLPLQQVSEMAMKAWRLLHDYQFSIKQLAQHSAANAQTLSQWITSFIKTCQQHGQITLAELPWSILQNLASLQPHLPKRIQLIGFDHLALIYQQLFNRLKKFCDVTVMSAAQQQPAATIHRVGLIQPDDEMITMARYCQHHWKMSPDAQIGCIVPQLLTQRENVVYSFHEVFGKQIPYNIAGGQALTRYPMIQTAIEWVAFTHQYMATEKLASLIQTPFIAGAHKEFVSRAILSQQLLQTAERYTTLHHLLSLAKNRNSRSYSPILNKKLDKLINVINKQPEKANMIHWVTYIKTCLEVIGWPGAMDFSAEEFQLLARWEEMLNELGQLAHVLNPMPLTSAIRLLQRLGQQALFQPETPSQSRIQVLGLREAAGFTFDYCWIMGMSDTTWPPPPEPNPLLPIQWQKQAKIPNTDTVTAAYYAQQLTHRFIHCSRHVTFSYLTQHEEQVCKPSPLIAHYPEKTLQQILPTAWYSTAQQLFYQRPALEQIEDHYGPPLTQQQHSGGTNIIKYQHNCPFQAFARLRLGAEQPSKLELGLRPQERGTLLHDAMLRIWRQLKSQTALIEHDDLSLKHFVRKVITQTLHEHISQRPLTLKRNYLMIEIKRITQHINQWLQLEKKRPAFVIKDLEQKYQVTFDKLTLSVRIDRIDKTPQGKTLILDYKTGKVTSAKQLAEETLTDVQLPIYLQAVKHNVSAVGFALIKADKAEFVGIAESAIAFKGFAKVVDWQATQQNWEQQLLTIAHQFCQGYAAVLPREKKTCTHCHLHALCRIQRAR